MRFLYIGGVLLFLTKKVRLNALKIVHYHFFQKLTFITYALPLNCKLINYECPK